ncbi:MAG: alkaline phosphatase family protein [Deltaproteobacteria bacterium]|nr:alkaline phosphatase family protein [Nannocystaceae bacterium]
MIRRAILAFVVLVALAFAAAAMRRATIKRFFPDGQPGAAPELTQPEQPEPDAATAPAAGVRVILLDGLSRTHAERMPTLSRHCGTGLELTVDVGFPTVSLPVQHALWTGRTQQQSGVQYRIARLPQPPADALPVRVPGSVAIAESHRDIVHSFGFSRTEPALDRDDIEPVGSRWRTHEFEHAATAAIASDAPLVFVHVLRIDEAGHAEGASSMAYAEAASAADDMLARWIAADPRVGRTRWFVLSDHGHRPAGGHGDAEDHIRIVHTCVFGDLQESDHDDVPIHLVDLHRGIADALGVAPGEESMGRPLGFARTHVDERASLPRVPTRRWVVATLAALAVVVVSAWGRRRWLYESLPWPLVAMVTAIVVHGRPSLSNPVVYPPLGFAVMAAALPGALWLLVALVRSRVHEQPGPVLRGYLGAAFASVVLLAIACGVPGALLGGPPPLVPLVTGWLSMSTSVLVAGLVAAAIAVPVSSMANSRRVVRRPRRHHEPV